MIATTVLAHDGSLLDESVRADYWYSFLDGYQPAEITDKLVAALLLAQKAELEALLPDGCHWHWSTGEIVGPVDVALTIDLSAAVERSCAAVCDQFDEIEAAVIEAI